MLNKKYILFVLIVLVLFNGCKKDQFRPDKKTKFLSERIVFSNDIITSSTEYFYNNKGKLIEKLRKNMSTNSEYRYMYNYNDEGFLCTIRIWKDNSEVVKYVYTWSNDSFSELYYRLIDGEYIESDIKYNYTLNDDNQIVKKELYGKNPRNEWILKSITKFFWCNENLISSEEWRSEAYEAQFKTIKTTYNYDRCNNSKSSLISIPYYTISKNNVSSYSLTITDFLNNVELLENYYEYEYEYDEDDYPISKTVFRKGIEDYTITYKYNNN